MKKINIILVFLISLTIYACRKEIGKPSWDTDLLAPIVSGSLSIDNLLPDSILQANADSSLKIVYQNNIYTLSMDTLFKIHDTTINQYYSLPFGPQTLTATTNFVSTNTSTTYQLPGVELRTVIVKSGKVNYTIKNKVHEIMDFTYKIPSATLNGVQFSIDISVPAAVGNTPGIYSQVYDLSGYTIDLTGQTHNQVNTIYTNLAAHPQNDVVVNTTDSLIISNTFYDLIPYYAKGYFGQNTVTIGPATSNFTMFKRIVNGTLRLQDVNFNLQIENPIGLDARMYISNLSSINTRTNTPPIALTTTTNLINAPININRAAENNGNVYPTYANFPLNTGNSNIKPMIENLPDKFGYTMQITTNPLGNVSGSNDFIYSDHLLNAKLNMEIPLSFCATNLTLVDTLALSIASSNGLQSVNSGTITLFADNGFPFNAALQMYLLNDKNMITDSIFAYANTIIEAPINSSFRAIGKKLTKIVVPVSESRMNLLYNTKKVALKVKFNTSAQPNNIKIYSDYTLDVNLVGDFNYTVHLK